MTETKHFNIIFMYLDQNRTGQNCSQVPESIRIQSGHIKSEPRPKTRFSFVIVKNKMERSVFKKNYL